MKKKSGFKSLVSEDELKVFLSSTTAQKLGWLDGAREFYFTAVPNRTKRLAERMRKEKGW